MGTDLVKAPKLNPGDLKQQAAMPLDGFLRFDPWTDQVIMMHTTYEPLLSARDKMPFETSPVYIKLGYWKAPEPPPPPPAADNTAAPATATPADGTVGPPAGTPATGAPANPGTSTDTVPQPPPTPATTTPPQN